MTRTIRTLRRIAYGTSLATVALVLAACSSMMMSPGSESLTLKGASEVPANTSAATGTGTVTIAADHAVSGAISVTGMTPTMAHIHMAAEGTNGPVIVPMVQSGNSFTFPAGSKLTDAQYDAYKAGKLYVNVHSAAFPGGEVRAQLKGS